MPTIIGPRGAASVLAVVLVAGACAPAMEAPSFPPPGSSVLAFLEPVSRELTLETEARGALSSEDYTLPEGPPVQAWHIQGTAGEFVSIDLVSEEFDAFLRVLGPGLDEPLTNDDGAGGCNARVSFSYPETGRYLVVAQALYDGTGTYTLRASTTVAPPLEMACDPGLMRMRPLLEAPPLAVLGPDDSADGVLRADLASDAPTGDTWAVRAEPGTEVTVDLRSDVFDGYLHLTGPGIDGLLEDDDGGGRCHARITFQATSAEPYTVIAGGLDPSQEGPYTLTTSTDPGPPVFGSCGGYGGPDLGAVPIQGTALTVPGTIEDALRADDPTLPDGSHIRGYEVDGPAGACVQVDVMSDTFDTMLMVTLSGRDDVGTDDDGGDGTNSMTQFILPEDGPARVYVTSFGSDATGPFVLSASACGT